jgi:hypothetical protein
MLFGRPAEGGALRAAGRDTRIDMVRGLALLIIFINHMPGNVVSAYMPNNFGFSDAADAFVLLAGVSATFAYGGLIETRGFSIAALKLGGRLWTLYIAHLAVFILVCGVIAVAVTQTQNPLYIEAINIQPFFRDTGEALIGALTLTYQPSYLDILPLYIVLLALFPAIYYGVRLSPALTLFCSLAIWQVALALDLHLPNSGGHWFFNPFAWQVIFTLGVILGRSVQLGVTMPRLRSDKTNLAWSRLFHLGALAWLVIRWLPAGGMLTRSAVGRALACSGRNSLHVFCVGIVLAIIGQIVLAETSFALDVQLLLCAGGVTLLTGLGIFLSWYRSITSRDQRAEPAKAPGVASSAQARLPSFSSR